MTRFTEKEIIERERKLVDSARDDDTALMMAGGDRDRAALETITTDRLIRYEAEIAGMDVPDALKAWAVDIQARFGNAKVQIWNNRVSWLTALMIARWGEAECHWPDSFGEDEVRRAWRWYAKNETPEGITHLPRED